MPSQPQVWPPKRSEGLESLISGEVNLTSPTSVSSDATSGSSPALGSVSASVTLPHSCATVQPSPACVSSHVSSSVLGSCIGPHAATSDTGDATRGVTLLSSGARAATRVASSGTPTSASGATSASGSCETSQRFHLSATALQPAVSLSGSNLLLLDGVVFNTRSSFLLDSGASHNFISSTFLKRLGRKGLVKPSADSVHLPNGATLSSGSILPSVRINLSGFTDAPTFHVLPLDAFDIILGKEWLSRHNPDIDWVSHRVIINKLHRRFLLRCPPQSSAKSHPLLLSAMQFRKAVRDNSEFYLCHVKLVSDPSGETSGKTPLVGVGPLLGCSGLTVT